VGFEGKQKTKPGPGLISFLHRRVEGSAVVRLPTPSIMGDEKHGVRKVATAKYGRQRCSLLHKVRGKQQQIGVETRVYIRQADGVDAHRRQKSREGWLRCRRARSRLCQARVHVSDDGLGFGANGLWSRGVSAAGQIGSAALLVPWPLIFMRVRVWDAPPHLSDHELRAAVPIRTDVP